MKDRSNWKRAMQLRRERIAAMRFDGPTLVFVCDSKCFSTYPLADLTRRHPPAKPGGDDASQ